MICDHKLTVACGRAPVKEQVDTLRGLGSPSRLTRDSSARCDVGCDRGNCRWYGRDARPARRLGRTSQRRFDADPPAEPGWLSPACCRRGIRTNRLATRGDAQAARMLRGFAPVRGRRAYSSAPRADRESSGTIMTGAERIINDRLAWIAGGAGARDRWFSRRQPSCPRPLRWQPVVAYWTAGDWRSIVVGIAKDTPCVRARRCRPGAAGRRRRRIRKADDPVCADAFGDRQHLRLGDGGRLYGTRSATERSLPHAFWTPQTTVMPG